MKNIFLAGILTIASALSLDLSAFCQQRMPEGCTHIRGQIVCPPTQPSKPTLCAAGGPLIIKLDSAGTYKKRSETYTEMDDNLKCRGLNSGFFGAASDITWAFHADENLWSPGGAYKEKTMKFFELTSSSLAKINTAAFKDLSETGKLMASDGRYLTNPIEIDKELVMREQQFVEKALEQTENRAAIVSDINERIKRVLDRPFSINFLSATLQAMAHERNKGRFLWPDYEFDYGSIYNRVGVGEFLAERHRK